MTDPAPAVPRQRRLLRALPVILVGAAIAVAGWHFSMVFYYIAGSCVAAFGIALLWKLPDRTAGRRRLLVAIAACCSAVIIVAAAVVVPRAMVAAAYAGQGIRWRTSFNGTVFDTPLVIDGRALVRTTDGVYLVAVSDGAATLLRTPKAEAPNLMAVGVSGSTIYLTGGKQTGSEHAFVAAFDLSGRRLWVQSDDSQGWVVVAARAGITVVQHSQGASVITEGIDAGGRTSWSRHDLPAAEGPWQQAVVPSAAPTDDQPPYVPAALVVERPLSRQLRRQWTVVDAATGRDVAMPAVQGKRIDVGATQRSYFLVDQVGGRCVIRAFAVVGSATAVTQHADCLNVAPSVVRWALLGTKLIVPNGDTDSLVPVDGSTEPVIEGVSAKPMYLTSYGIVRDSSAGLTVTALKAQRRTVFAAGSVVESPVADRTVVIRSKPKRAGLFDPDHSGENSVVFSVYDAATGTRTASQRIHESGDNLSVTPYGAGRALLGFGRTLSALG